ncbi:hypothetical protein BO83DRAFT_455752 [Aspergillus eucalypticola CBS 122712]|uniref:Uncharacterized protein n=1 Tax=Aspergillus eucalypticola (strain CBS 122712 / IBT 29274) TaxID=1448314 RepID=A0A317UQC6_ASPEC|nr:uncharacterized protein BO83DRAFT_455752 [Aspergillus eucalypticola CBS 122712]PWY64203.1 hypothetical protein BO83DRAFT_455752 [Aspergillus eucalypticola CBS 122712]
MSSSRVIQDSDDEDDPLAGPISPDPESITQILTSGWGYAKSTMIQPLTNNPTFIGSMMTEIGIAQQRLFDDDEAHYTEQSGYQYTGDMDTAQAESAAVQEQIAAELPPHDDIALVPNEHPHGYSEQPPLYNETQPDISDTLPYGTGQHPLDAANLYTHQPTAQSNDYTSFNYSVTTGASYNMFESSLRPSGSFDPETNIPTHPTGTVDPEIAYNFPRRSDSVPPVPFSPHDTEPFSSVVSPKASRSKSDNAVQQSHQSVDALNGPVTIEIPVAEKKQRGRKKKQTIPEHDEDDELAQIHTPTKIQDATTTITTVPTTTNTTNNKPEKRKPGRPPKNPKPPRNEDDDQPGLISNDTTAFPIPPDTTTTTTSTDPLTTTEHQTTTTTTDPPPPKKQAKEPKKKKLKRGKTTSITLTKTYESDVEDDVIWVDERPVPTTITPQTEAETQQPGNIPEHEETTPTTHPEPVPELQPAPAPAPKKRGRKRKNPVEEQPPAPAPAPAIDPQQSSDKENNPVPDPNLTLHDDAKPQQEPNHKPPQEKEAEKENENKSEPQQEQNPTPSTPLKPSEGPTKHSPISSTTKVPYRVGLSRRARIAPLLKIVRR